MIALQNALELFLEFLSTCWVQFLKSIFFNTWLSAYHASCGIDIVVNSFFLAWACIFLIGKGWWGVIFFSEAFYYEFSQFFVFIFLPNAVLSYRYAHRLSLVLYLVIFCVHHFWWNFATLNLARQLTQRHTIWNTLAWNHRAGSLPLFTKTLNWKVCLRLNM